MAGVTETYPVTLTKVSDATVKLECNLATNDAGAPRLQLGAVSQEAASPAQRGSIRIDSLHEGSGQRVARNPRRYLSNVQNSAANGVSGWETWHEGVLLTVGDRSKVDPGDSTYRAAASDQSAAFFATPDEANIHVTARRIFEGTAQSAGEVSPNGASDYYTGSQVIFGDRSFFAAEHQGTREGGVVTVRSSAGSYNNNAGWSANGLAIVGARMFRLRYDATNEIWYVSWTDETGADSPTWSTEYPLPAGGRIIGRIEAIQGQVIVGLSNNLITSRMDTVFYAVDLEGTVTPVTSSKIGGDRIVASGTFLGRPIFLLNGHPMLVWFRDVLDMVVLNLDAFAPDESSGSISNGETTGGIVSLGNRCYVAVGNDILVCEMSSRGWHVHQFADMDNSASQDSTLIAINVVTESLAIALYALTAESGPLDGIFRYNWDLHNRGTLAGGSGQSSILTTSVYDGNVWVSKKFTRIRGYVHLKSAGSGSLTITALVDGVDKGSGTVTADGAFSITLDGDAVGRGIHLTFALSGDYTCAVEFPVDIDFFYVPDQHDVISLPVVIGRDQITQGATLDKFGRQTLYDLLTDAVDSPEGWTLHFGDGRTDWTVIPVGLEARPLDPEYLPGSDSAIVWLSLQRV